MSRRYARGPGFEEGVDAQTCGVVRAELLTVGRTEHEISAFSRRRPAIVDPDFAPVLRLGTGDLI